MDIIPQPKKNIVLDATMLKTKNKSIYQIVVHKSDGDYKLCSICKELKLLTEFTFDKRISTGRQAWCKDCFKINQAHNRTPEKVRANNLKQMYNISIDEYQEMYENQKGKCAICKNPFEVLHVDHCHNSNKIRGLLCHNCNIGIGNLQDSIQILQSAIEYLKKE